MNEERKELLDFLKVLVQMNREDVYAKREIAAVVQCLLISFGFELDKVYKRDKKEN